MCHPISFRFKQPLQLAQTSSPSFICCVFGRCPRYPAGPYRSRCKHQSYLFSKQYRCQPHRGLGRRLVARTLISQQLQEDFRQNASELTTLQETVTAQCRLIGELEHNNGTSTQPRTADVADLKSKMDEQNRTISKLPSQLTDLQQLGFEQQFKLQRDQ